jgi:hypothetical protein
LSKEFHLGDFSAPNLPKEATRLFNLYEVQRSFATARTGELQGNWLELCGRGAPTLELLLRTRALPTGRSFIGVDRNKENIRFNRENFSEEARSVWAEGDFRRILNTGVSNATPIVGLGEVVVVNYDTCGLAKGSEWQADMRALRMFMDARLDNGAPMVVIVNAGLVRGPGLEDFCRDVSTFLDLDVSPETVVIYHGETVLEDGVQKHGRRANVVLHCSRTRGGTARSVLERVKNEMGSVPLNFGAQII